jgi:hypothetical protein
VAGKPERMNVLFGKCLVDEIDNALKISVVHLGTPRSRSRLAGIRRRNDQLVLVLVARDRKIVPLPVSKRTATMQIQHESDLIARLKTTGKIQEDRPTAVRLGCVAGVRHQAARILAELIVHIRIAAAQARERCLRRCFTRPNENTHSNE